jgi:hypothetical protein
MSAEAPCGDLPIAMGQTGCGHDRDMNHQLNKSSTQILTTRYKLYSK